jgi:catechol 2,3-dioxygenase-like lactoylglutathione lyase family enzyme
MKVVINKCYGGFGVSLEGCRWMADHDHVTARQEVDNYEKRLREFEHYKKHGVMPPGSEDSFRASLFDISIRYNTTPEFHAGYDFERDDPLLVRCVEVLGPGANALYAELAVVELPDDVKYEIAGYDGREHIAEKHRTWP